MPYRAAPVVDGDLGDWTGSPLLSLDKAGQVLHGAPWGGAEDAALDLWLAWDTNHLFLAGNVRDDVLVAPRGSPRPGACDAIELFLAAGTEDRDHALAADDLRLLLLPLHEARPFSVLDPRLGAPRQGTWSLTGFALAGQRLDHGYRFEAAIPFHQVPRLRPGQRTLGLGVVLHDCDSDTGPGKVLSWSGRDPIDGGLGRLRFGGDGPLVGEPPPAHLLGGDFLADLPYLLAPLLAAGLLFLLLRAWPALRRRVRWLRPALLAGAVAVFLLSLLLPSVWLDLRDGHQQSQLEAALAVTRQVIAKGEEGTLASYRGPSRDRALMDLLNGKTIARQRYTSYRFLSQLVGQEMGASLRDFPGELFQLRPYWVPLARNRTETFHFDPPLRGEELLVVVGRPAPPSLLFALPPPRAQIKLELGFGSGAGRSETVVLDREFVPAVSLGRELHEVEWRSVQLGGELRTLGVTAEEGDKLALVALSLVPRRGEPAQPLFLGSASLDGVQTDLRGPYPEDAGIELGPGAAAKVVVPPERSEPCQRLWLFYRATYPGVPTANPGATVAEVTIRFRGRQEPRLLTLEHQVSMFYEMVVHNTRDQPPDGSPAGIAFSWLDDNKERHINMVLPVTDLPPGAEIESIEFVNRADYRMRFRSVVLGSEKAAAPQDPDDSPLVRDGPDRRLLDESVRQALGAATIAIYRDRLLRESTLPADQRQDLLALPRDLAPGAALGKPRIASSPGGARRAMVHVPLTGDGWDGAVLAVIVTDDGWQAARELANRIALLLALCSAPVLLLLLSEGLAALTSLRVRLMTVLSAASLLPLLLLSFALASVIERGHDSDQQEGMRQDVRSAMGQLAEQMQRLRGSAQQWLQDQAQLFAARIGKVADDKFEARLLQTLPALQQLLGGQLPPEWRGGFLRLDWSPAAGSPGGEPRTLLAGDARMATAEAPARLEPSVYVHGGTVAIAVRSETEVRGGSLALTVARPLGTDFLGALAPGQSVLLCDPRGYPLELAGTRLPTKALLAHGRQPAVMQQRERALFAVLDERLPVVERTASAYGEWLCGHEVLRDLQGTPRALLVLAEPDQRATLDLPIGRIAVRAFFFLVAGLLLVLAAFLSFVVSGRISRPVELLERGTQAIARGELAARVPVEERGQLGRLTLAFNQMAAGLEGRLLDLQQLNRAMRELSTNLDSSHTLTVLRRFCEQHTAVDRVRIALLDPASGRLEVHGGPEVGRIDPPPELAFLPRAAGAFCLWWPRVPADRLPFGLPGIQSAIGLPLLVGGRCLGAVLLLFESRHPPLLELDLLASLTAQAAVALDNAELYRHAVQDPATGAFVPEYFRRRTAEELALAQPRGMAVTLLEFGLGEPGSRPRGLQSFAATLRECAPHGSLLGHAGPGQLQLLVPGMTRPMAEALVGRVLEAWQRAVDAAPDSDIEHRPPTTAMVVFPDEAASAEFLFDALRDRLASGSALAPAAIEVDSSLQRAGIVAASPAMRDIYRTLRRVAPTDLGVLFLGETGTGKEVLTNLVHRWSKRAAGPLVKVHCAALTETLLASELFGHERGAFTGADRRKIGKFEQANGGTIFLDEVGEIPLDVQVKLLRVLQEREVDRVGGIDPVPIDVRIVAATNRDLEVMIAQGRFREDLYYRLQGIVVQVPPLRERKQEIAALVEQFRAEVVASGQSRVRGLSTDAMDELFRRDWPGNIRELRNAVYRAMVLATGDVVELRDVLAALPAFGSAQSQLPTKVSGGRGEMIEDLPAAPIAAKAPATETEPNDLEPVVPLPAAVPVQPAWPGNMPPRVRRLYDRLLAQGSLGTQDHVVASGISHRTGLRDLQLLVELGLAERVGSRRGARYRPTNRP